MKGLLLLVGAVLALGTAGWTGHRFGAGKLRIQVEALRHEVAAAQEKLAKKPGDESVKLRNAMGEMDILRIQLENARREIRTLNQAKLAFGVMEDGGPHFLSMEQMANIKLHFNDLQREVAAGNFKGLALTPAYQELRKVFDHPDFDRLVRWHDASMPR